MPLEKRTRLGIALIVGLLLAAGGIGARYYLRPYLLGEGDTSNASGDTDKSLNTLSDEEKAQGWKLLFDGQSTDGWRRYKGKGVPEGWQVSQGALVYKPKKGVAGGDIVTNDEYDNFELSLEWVVQIGGNSGVMYRVTEAADVPYGSGPEYQILDNARHPDGKGPKTSAASCYALYAPSKDLTRPLGQWNQARIVVNGPHVEHWLNGEKVVEYEIGSDDWKKRVAASKFKDMPQFAKAAKGHIDLQDHGDEVAFRNIKIRPLTEKKLSAEKKGQ